MNLAEATEAIARQKLGKGKNWAVHTWKIIGKAPGVVYRVQGGVSRPSKRDPSKPVWDPPFDVAYVTPQEVAAFVSRHQPEAGKGTE